MEEEYSPENKLRVFMDFEQDNIEGNRTAIEDSVRENIKKAQAKQKETYDCTRKKRRGSKLDYCWEGPFV